MWRRMVTASAFILVSLLITLLYGDTPLFRKLETGVFDLHMFFNKPPEDSKVVIVRITDADYQNHFGGKSPLNPVKLREIIGAIVSVKPRAIGVALDTSPSEFQTLDVPPEWPPIVWARGSVYSNLRRKHLLSGALGRYNPPMSCCGVVELERDPDGAIRRYARWYDTDAGAMPSLPWAVLMKFRNEESRPEAAHDFEEEFLIDYPGPPSSHYFVETTVSALLDPRRQALADNNIFKDNIVLLGGDYGVQDEHDTPVGWMLGAEILASIIETEQRGDRRRPLGTAEILLLAAAAGVVLSLLIHLFAKRKLLFAGVVTVVAGVLMYGLLLLGSLHYVGHFLLVFVAVLLHQAYEWGKEYLGKRRGQAADELK